MDLIQANEFKIRNVIDMAVTFTAMGRVFEEGSKAAIVAKLEESLGALTNVADRESFEVVHREFCEWFVLSVKTAPKKYVGRATKPSEPASYGQAAKVFDISTKVFVHYCHLPTCEAAKRLLPLLHGAIDTPILNHLQRRYSGLAPAVQTIQAITVDDYQALQGLIARQIGEDFNNKILPVHYDDILWNQLNRLSV